MNFQTTKISLGRWDREKIERMLTAFNNYNDRVRYRMIPDVQGSHNSNSFTRGLLDATGVRTDNLNVGSAVMLVPGWNQPLGRNHFR